MPGTGIQQTVNRGIVVYIPGQDRQPFPYLLVVLYNPVIDMLLVLDQADIVKEDQVGAFLLIASSITCPSLAVIIFLGENLFVSHEVWSEHPGTGFMADKSGYPYWVLALYA